MPEPTLYVWRCEACGQVDAAAVVTDGSRYGLHRGVCGGQCLRIPVVPAEQLERAVEALRWYADEKNYDPDGVLGVATGLAQDFDTGAWEIDDWEPDRGHEAREALKALGRDA